MTVDQLKPNQVQRDLDFPEPVEGHAHQKPASEFSIHGVEKTDATGGLCRLNLAVHELEGDIRHGGNVKNYDDDPHDATGRFDVIVCRNTFHHFRYKTESLASHSGQNRTVILRFCEGFACVGAEAL